MHSMLTVADTCVVAACAAVYGQARPQVLSQALSLPCKPPFASHSPVIASHSFSSDCQSLSARSLLAAVLTGSGGRYDALLDGGSCLWALLYRHLPANIGRPDTDVTHPLI